MKNLPTRLKSLALFAFFALGLASSAWAGVEKTPQPVWLPESRKPVIPTLPPVEKIETDNAWETKYNPYAKPDTMPHWLSNLCYHDYWTNGLGGAEGQWYHECTWFLGTNTIYTSNQKDSPNYFKTVRIKEGPNQTWGTVPTNETCLAMIEAAARKEMGTSSDKGIGKTIEVGLCELLRPFESTHCDVKYIRPDRYGNQQPQLCEAGNANFWTNFCYSFGADYDQDGPSRRNPNTGNRNYMWLEESIQAFGPKLDGSTFRAWHSSSYLNYNDAYHIWTPSRQIDMLYEQYSPGISNCIARLESVPADWTGTYLLAAGTNEVARADGSNWPMLDENVYLDRGDVLMLRFAAYAIRSGIFMAKAYKLPGLASGSGVKADAEMKAVAKCGSAASGFRNFGSRTHFSPYMHNPSGQVDEQGNPAESIGNHRGQCYSGHDKHHTIFFGRRERIEQIFYNSVHIMTNLCSYIDDEPALKAAREDAEKALECFLDADAFITGKKVSETGNQVVGSRNLDQLHLIEFDEADEDEDGGEWNFAAYREMAVKTYRSLKGKGTDAAQQVVDLVKLGKQLDIHAGSEGVSSAEEHGTVDFSKIGANKDGKVTVDANAIFDGKVCRNYIVKDAEQFAVTNGMPKVWVMTSCGMPRNGGEVWRGLCITNGNGEVRWWIDEGASYFLWNGSSPASSGTVPTYSNCTHELHLNVGPQIIDRTLNGLLPDGSLFDDLMTMKAQFPADGGVTNRCGFSKMLDNVYNCERMEVKTDTIIPDGIYSAEPTTDQGGVFSVGGGVTLTGTNVTFSGNSAADGGAIYNRGTVKMNGTFTLATAGDTIDNNGTLEWNLADGNKGFLAGYDKLVNWTKLQITIDDAIQPTTNIVIATGDFTRIDSKKTLTVKNGAVETTVTIDGSIAGPTGGTVGYKLVTEAAGETTNLVFQVLTVDPRVVVNASNSPYTITNCTYTTVPTTENGGAVSIEMAGVLVVTNVTFKDNETTGAFGAIDNSGETTLKDVTFSGNRDKNGDGAVYNGGRINFDGFVTLETATDKLVNDGGGTLNWNLAGGNAGVLNGYEKLGNYSGTLQITVETYAKESTEFVIATGDFSNIEDKKTFVITNSVAGGEAATVEIDGESVIANFAMYQLYTEEVAEAIPPMTNLIFKVVKPDMTTVVVNSNWEGKYKPGEEIEIEGETYYYGLTAFAEVPSVPNALSTTEELIIAGGSASITNEVTLKKDEGGNPVGKLVLKDGATLSIMGEDAILKSLADTSSISGSGAIYVDKSDETTALDYYKNKLVKPNAITVARASVDDKKVKDTAKVEEGGKTYYNVITGDQPTSGETNNTVVTSAIVVDGADDTDGLLLKANEKPLIVAGSVTTTAPDQTLKLVKEQAADLTVNGKVSGFETITVENKNEAGKMVTTSTLAANQDITILNDGHLDAKALAGGKLYINNTSANTIIGEYSGQNIYFTNTTEGVAQDITLQAYGTDAKAGTINLFGRDGSVYSNVVLVAGKNATPENLSVNDGSGKVFVVGTNTLSGSVQMKASAATTMSTGDFPSPILRLENADAILSLSNVFCPAEIYGDCNIASNDNGAVRFTGAVTLKDGAVLGGKTRLASNIDNFTLEGTVTLKDGAEVDRGDNFFEVPSDATLKLQGSKIATIAFTLLGTLDIESGLNDVNKIGSEGTINLKGGELIIDGDGYLSNTSGGVLNWDLTAGTTTLDWSKVSGSGTWMATVGDVASGTSYTLATNATAANVTQTFTVTNSVAGGAAATVKAGGVCKAGGQFWALSISEAGELQLTAFDPVKLDGVFLIDETTGKTNATAVVKAGGNTFEPEADGSFEVPANYPLDVVYEAANYGQEDGMMFGPGLRNKTLVIENGIAGNKSLDDPEYADLKASIAAQCQAQWVDGEGEAGGRDIALDTRERIVITSPNDVLPLAYSTNYWGEVEGGNNVSLTVTPRGGVEQGLVSTNENGYAEWMPTVGAYGLYDVGCMTERTMGFPVTTNATIYYSTYFPISWAAPVGGTLAVTNEGAAVASGDEILGYSLLNLAATVENHYKFEGWSAMANDTPVGEFGDKSAPVTTFEMPLCGTELKADIVWQSTFTEKVTVNEGSKWEVYEDDNYQKGITNNGTIVWRPGTTNALGKASGLSEYSQIHNGTNGVLQIAFDKSLTNGVYKLAGNAKGAIGQKFQLANGTSTADITAVDKKNLGKADWVYIGAKRAKLYVDDNGDLCVQFTWGVAFGIYMRVSPIECGNAATRTNAQWTAWTYPDTTVTCVAFPATNCVLDTWIGTNDFGKAIAFADPKAETTTFTMPETNVSVCAYFKVDPAYQAEIALAVSNAAHEAAADVEKLTLTRKAKDGFCAEIASNRNVQVAAVLAAKTPAEVRAAKAAADKAFAKTLENAKILAAVPYPIAWAVAPTNIAGTVAVTNLAKVTELVPVEAKSASNWVFVAWTAYTNGLEITSNAVTNVVPVVTEVFTNTETAVSAFRMPATNILIRATFEIDPAFRAAMVGTVTGNALEAVGAITNMNLTVEEKQPFAEQVETVRTNAVAEIGKAETPAAVEAIVLSATGEIAKIRAAAQEMADREWTITAEVDPDDAGAVNVSTNRSQARKTITVTAVAATNWLFDCWAELDPTNGIVTVETQGKATLVFEMPETNVNLVAKFMLNEAYRDEGKAAITNAAVSAKAKVAAMNLSEAEMEAFSKAVLEAETAALESLKDAKSPADVDAVVSTAVGKLAAIVAEAQELADREWAIVAAADPEDAGAINVSTNSSQARLAVTVTAVANTNYVFAGWTGKDSAGNDLKFADATNLVTTFTMPETNVTVTAGFKVDATCKERAAAEVSVPMTNCLASIDRLALTDEEKARYSDEIIAAGTNALAQIESAKTVQEVESATFVTQSFQNTVRIASQYANREWAIGATVEPAEAGTVVVTDAARRWTAVSVEAVANEDYVFTGWTGTDATGKAIAFADPTNLVTTFEMPETNVSVKAVFTAPTVSFATNAVVGVEGEELEVVVNGGSETKPTQVTVSLQKNTLTSFTAYYGLDTRGNAKRCSFPLVLNWDAGDTEPKVIVFKTNENRKKTMVDQFLTLQLGSEVNFGGIGAYDVCTVTVRDSEDPTPDTTPYIRAIAWPANGGKVSGFGKLSVNRNTGAITSTKTLTATANKWATFEGWYAAKADDPNAIDTNAIITVERKLKVGKGTDYTNGTYFAYFTDVAPVAAVDVPDAAAAGAAGVSCDDGVYVGTVGVRFALPVSITDETDNGTLTVSGLPSGLTYNKKTGRIEGVPTKASEKTVKFIARNAAGKHTTTFDFAIEAIDYRAVGTWNGLVRELEDPEDGTHAGFGTVTFTAGKTGSLSAKIMTRVTGTKSFSAKGYIRIDDCTYAIAMTNSTKEVFQAVLSYTNDWTAAQLTGTVTGGKLAVNDEEVKFVAIRNAFDKKEGNEDALELLGAYMEGGDGKGVYTADLYPENANATAADTVTFTVKAGGSVLVKAKSGKLTYTGTCAGAFSGFASGDSVMGGVHAAIRSGKRLWATDTVLATDGAALGLACEYDADGDHAHTRVGEASAE